MTDTPGDDIGVDLGDDELADDPVDDADITTPGPNPYTDLPVDDVEDDS